jgi:hypothetical protein
MNIKQAVIGTMAVAVLATVVSVAPAHAGKHKRHRGGDCDDDAPRVIVVNPAPAPLIYADDVTVPGEFAVVRPFHGQRLVNVWDGQRWVTRVIYY